MGKDEVPIRHLPPDQNRARWPAPITNQEPIIDPAALQDAWLDIRNDPAAVELLLRRLNDEEEALRKHGEPKRIWTRRVLNQMLSPGNICAMAQCSTTLCTCGQEPEFDPENTEEQAIEWGRSLQLEPVLLGYQSRATEGFERDLHNALDA